MVKKRMAVAMSGGVDSTVTAQLLLAEGIAVHGLFMNLGQPDFAAQLANVKKICQQLDVLLTVVDVREVFQRAVIDYFCTSYFHGRTPNPCVVCNPSVKCGELIKQAILLGCEGLATGHYVRKMRHHDGWVLARGVDGTKDQSYFLCGLRQEQIAFLEFPLGETEKETVYGLAEGFGFRGFRGQESQDICFLKNQSVQEFLAHHGGQVSHVGEIVDTDGRVLGRHQGIENYTIGQRKGLGISAPEPLYVVQLDRAKQQVVVGHSAALFRQRLEVAAMNWLTGVEPALPAEFLVKIRHRHAGALGRVEKQDTGYVITFTEPQRAVTPGQFAALYAGESLLGGGEIV